MKFTTLLPVRFNDGTPVPQATIDRILDDWTAQFGGRTMEGVTQGRWIDPTDGTEYRDDCYRVSVLCDNDQYDAARHAVLEAGRLLGQKAMWFEVRDFDGVRILTTDR